jgi:hypothetical protein
MVDYHRLSKLILSHIDGIILSTISNYKTLTGRKSSTMKVVCCQVEKGTWKGQSKQCLSSSMSLWFPSPVPVPFLMLSS